MKKIDKPGPSVCDLTVSSELLSSHFEHFEIQKRNVPSLNKNSQAFQELLEGTQPKASISHPELPL